MSDTTDDDLATLLAKREHARPNRLTWVLLVLLVLAVGFAGGAFVEKRNASSSSGLPDFAALRAGGGFPSGAGGAFPGGAAAGTGTDAGGAVADVAGATIGTVKLVDGNNLYVTDANGNTVKVVVPKTVKVTTQAESPLSDLSAGSTVVIRGATGDDGTVTATSVTEGSATTADNPIAPSTSPSSQGETP